MGRAPCCDKANVKKGPWSPEEDSKLKDYIDKNGTGGNWITLPHKAGLRRCGKSCRLRWLNYLRPNIKHGEFSVEEDRVICSLYATIGSRWSIIAAQLPGRTDNDIKNYWNTKLKKKLMAFAAAAAATSSITPDKPAPSPSIYPTSSQMTSLYSYNSYYSANPSKKPLMDDNQQTFSCHRMTNPTSAATTSVGTSCCLETGLSLFQTQMQHQNQQYYQPLMLGSDHQQTSCSSNTSDNGGTSCGNKHDSYQNNVVVPSGFEFDDELHLDNQNNKQRHGLMLHGYDEINNDNLFLSHQFDHQNSIINSSTDNDAPAALMDFYVDDAAVGGGDKQQQLNVNMNNGRSFINNGGDNNHQVIINSKITSLQDHQQAMMMKEKDERMMMYYDFNTNYC
uniref:Uncharacterized protein n=2 Tax=Kalanchoe fedtschenkoi TaxID=63787 RepID=A0A7N0TY88_KALFE